MPKRYEPKNPNSESLLRLARIARGMSQQELAEESGMRQHAISHIEHRGREPLPSTKKLLALVLGYEVSDLFPPDGRATSTTSPELLALLKEEKRRQARERRKRRSKP